jgi:hypothetical protein
MATFCYAAGVQLGCPFPMSEYRVNARLRKTRAGTGFFKADRRQLSAPLDRESNSPGGD